VDQHPWQQQLHWPRSVSTEERELAREAKRLADHEVDQAFSQSLRQASAETRELKGEALTLQRRVTELQEMVNEDQARIAALTSKAGISANRAAGVAAGVTVVDGDLDIAKAQLGLDQNELSDSVEDINRVSGDQRIKIQKELSARQAAMKKYDAQAAEGEGETAVTSSRQYATLTEQISAWLSQRSMKQLIEQTEKLARADVSALTQDHARLETEAKSTEANADMRQTRRWRKRSGNG
jgi:hypothetical protein